jgi:diacylglycerol kinase (ATP)
VTTPHYQKDVSWRSRYRTFVHAGRGISTLLATQWNARIHAVCALVVTGVGFWLGLDRIEWCLIILAIGFVWVTEGLNTAIEFVVDKASPEIHTLAKHAKDVAAGAVLSAAFVSVLIGFLVLGPKLLEALNLSGGIEPR